MLENLGELCKKIGYLGADNQWNEDAKGYVICCDETGNKFILNTAKTTTSDLVEARKRKTTNSGHISLFAFHDLNCDAYPPLVITSHKRSCREACLQAAEETWPGCVISSSESGYINSLLFYHTIYKIAESKELSATKPLIVICDGHTSRFSVKFLLECMKRHIWIFVGVPNGTHIYQTLDNLIFKEFNRIRYQLKMEFEIQLSKTVSFTTEHEIAIMVTSLRKVMKDTKQYIEGSCKNCGIVPFDPSKLKRLVGETIEIEIDGENVSEVQMPDKKPAISCLFKEGGLATTTEIMDYIKSKGNSKTAAWRKIWKKYNQ